MLARRWSRRGGPHLLWWAAGIFTYGLGTALEAAITLAGNSAALNKAWYVAGALLGGYPLAQGTVYLLLSRRTARILTVVTVPVIAALAALVVLSPLNHDALDPRRPSGAILGWQWLRAMTPLVNGYAALFLIGGAVLSAFRWARTPGGTLRSAGNVYIAAGALLPGVGGAMAKAGIVEALYVGEFAGLLLIWAGYGLCVRHAPGAAGEPAAARA